MSKEKKIVIIDGNEAASYIAHKTSEVCAIYPITPSSAMGEWADTWSAEGKTNIWGTVPTVIEMQSEGGAAGAVHGALQTGALTSTFTASQGLLLMIPNMYKIAGELTSTVFHVSARTVATHALSIFCDHSDVMAARQTGFAFLSSAGVQEVMDLGLIAHAATLRTRIPFVHFFDGFRTSSEVMKITQIPDDDIRAMIDDDLVFAHRQRGMNPNDPVLRGTAQNPDVFFQARESINPYYNAAPQIIQDVMDQFNDVVGRRYNLFDYYGSPDAENVIVMMGSSGEAALSTISFMRRNLGKHYGVVKVRLYRPFSTEHFINALPKTVKKIAVLDRTKEPGAIGEPLYQDVITALVEEAAKDSFPFEKMPVVIGGRYGLSSKEFTPGMIKSILSELDKDKPKNHFTIGINDDVTSTSLEFKQGFLTYVDKVFRGMFFGLGSDGTVGANKNSIKIIGESTDNFAQGFFVYDSKKSGSTTTSYLRFGEQPIRKSYLIRNANFIACHQFELLKTIDILQYAETGATFLLNSPFSPAEIWDKLPPMAQNHITHKNLQFYIIDALKVAKETGMRERINTIMQTCFFAISDIIPKDEAVNKIKETIFKTYSKKGEAIVGKNYNAVDQALAHLHKVEIPETKSDKDPSIKVVSDAAPEFVKKFTAEIIAGRGDDLPVSAFSPDGTFPTATTQWEKRNVGSEIPVWNQEICIQCNKCALVCPHATIRMKVYDKGLLDGAPPTFKSIKAKGKEWNENDVYTLQVAAEDCTGCTACVDVCPVKDKKHEGLKAINMEAQIPLRKAERANWNFFLDLPEVDRNNVKHHTVKGSQLLRPLFEFSGACSGCGETPYVKLVSQLFGDRMIVANATGCSSIYGGNLPTTPWAKNEDGRGPTWSNSLFEDNAEFGFGFRLTIDKHQKYATEMLTKLRSEVGDDLADSILNASQLKESEIYEQRERVAKLNDILKGKESDIAKQLLSVSDNLVKKSVWIMGGDGWAYDIGYGGLDHVLASGKNVNILVLDTEVYSNTGGQASKSTPYGAIAKFAASGKGSNKKDLGMMAMTYDNVYVAQVAYGSNDAQTVKALLEAELYEGTSIIIAYSPCIAHGINMAEGLKQHKMAVDSGHWLLYRHDPRRIEAGKNPLVLDSKPPKIAIEDYIYSENRYSMLKKTMPERAEMLLKKAEQATNNKYDHYKKLSEM